MEQIVLNSICNAASPQELLELGGRAGKIVVAADELQQRRHLIGSHVYA